MDDIVRAFCETEYTLVIAGEPEEVEHSRWKICYEVPLLSKETGTRLHSFVIATYSYEARQVELGGVDCVGNIGSVTYFEVFNSILRKTKRTRISGDTLVDSLNLKYLLKELYLDLEEIMQ